MADGKRKQTIQLKPNGKTHRLRGFYISFLHILVNVAKCFFIVEKNCKNHTLSPTKYTQLFKAWQVRVALVTGLGY